MYLVLNVQSTEHIDNCSLLNAWVNVPDRNEAMKILSEELSHKGWVVTDIIDSSITDESDYFPPCKSLDAFNEAKSSLFALRFS